MRSFVSLRPLACQQLGYVALLLPLFTGAPVWAQSTPDSGPAISYPGLTIREYVVPPRLAESVAQDWRNRMADYPEVRVSADAQTGTISVVAPEMVHQELNRQVQSIEAARRGTRARTISMQQPADPNGPSTDGASASQAPPPKATVVSVKLEHSTAEEMEARLSQLWGPAFQPGPNTQGDLVSYRLAHDDGSSVQVHFDRAAGRVIVWAPKELAEPYSRLIHVLDTKGDPETERTDVVPIGNADPNKLRMALEAYRLSANSEEALAGQGGPAANDLARTLFRRRNQQPNVGPQVPEDELDPEAAEGQPLPEGDPVAQPGTPGTGLPGGLTPEDLEALVGNVRVEVLPEFGIIILIGPAPDVERMRLLIERIEELSETTQPVVEILPLQHVNSAKITTLVNQVYTTNFGGRLGSVNMTALIKPNAVLLIGPEEGVKTVKGLFEKLDVTVAPDTEFEVFLLKRASALAVQDTVRQFFTDRQGGDRPGLGTTVQVQADFRTNALIVQASPRDMLEVAVLIEKIDSNQSGAVHQMRVVNLRNSLATELAPILQEAITGRSRTGAGAGGQGQGQGGGGQFFQQGGGGGGGGTGGSTNPQQALQQQQKSLMLQFQTLDTEGQRTLKSGILADVRIIADARTNALLVSAPEESIELVVSLVEQLDRIPAAIAQIKVFTIVNGDASALVDMLENLFGITGTGAGRAAGPQLAQAFTSGGESSLVSLRFSVDPRTNSIIASGSEEDLQVVEAILLRLDDSEVKGRVSKIYRLKNAPAPEVADAINRYLQSERQVQQAQPGVLSPFEQLEREVVVEAETFSNSLIVAATPRYFEEIAKLVEELDSRPPMVMIQVLIGEVTLNNTDEFGVELGIQDSALFQRSLLDSISNLTTTTTQNVPPQNLPVTTQQQTIQNATMNPGFNFNTTSPLGNNGSTASTGTRGRLAGQGLTNLSVGRSNTDLGYGGLVLSASSESVSLLVRALAESRRLEVLSRPQIMTLDNQPAFIQVGQRVPVITSSTISATGQTNATQQEPVGIILGVTPRVSVDGQVTMEIDAERSEVGPENEGIPVTISATGEVVRSPRINTTLAQTTVSAASGQTIVLGGLITNNKRNVQRRVPGLSRIPILGHLFRYDGVSKVKTELLIIMTPHVIRNQDDAERMKQLESARMHWCLADVENVYGSVGLRSRSNPFPDHSMVVINPDEDPTGEIGMQQSQMMSPDSYIDENGNRIEMLPSESELPAEAYPADSAPQYLPQEAVPADQGFSPAPTDGAGQTPQSRPSRGTSQPSMRSGRRPPPSGPRLTRRDAWGREPQDRTARQPARPIPSVVEEQGPAANATSMRSDAAQGNPGGVQQVPYYEPVEPAAGQRGTPQQGRYSAGAQGQPPVNRGAPRNGPGTLRQLPENPPAQPAGQGRPGLFGRPGGSRAPTGQQTAYQQPVPRQGGQPAGSMPPPNAGPIRPRRLPSGAPAQ